MILRIDVAMDGRLAATATVVVMADLDSIPRAYGVGVHTVGPPSWDRRGFVEGHDLEVWELVAKVAEWAAAEAEKR